MIHYYLSVRMRSFRWIILAVLTAIAFHRGTAFSITGTRKANTQRSRSHTFQSSKRRQYSSWPSSVFRLNQSSENAGVVQSANTTSSSSSYDEELALLTEKVEEAFPKGEILTMTMKDHKPLGCTVEESLNEEDDYVFISKITEGGNADKAGLKVGDVVVGVTGLFGELTVVMDSGVEKM
jgi:C-terminal processing protease CtpA/Prc